MKRTFCALTAIAGLFIAQSLKAQDASSDNDNKKSKSRSISISNKGIKVEETDSTTSKAHAGKVKLKDDKPGEFHLSYLMFDLGVNILNDETVYTDPSVVNYLNVPANRRNENLFDLRNSKSINVNLYPVMVKLLAAGGKNQKLYVSTGLGLQMYNFRYENNISYTKNPNGIILDTVSFSKNKLGVTYLSVPLMLTGKTRLHKSKWLVYGAGITAGYRLGSKNKQISDERNKVKTRGNFDLNDFNTCLTAEFGVEGILRFYASYQLTSMYDNGINQRPICFGVRLSGI